MTNEQSKGHWWIVENHTNFRIEPPKKYFEICDIVYDALSKGQSLPIQNVMQAKPEKVCINDFCERKATNGDYCYTCLMCEAYL